MKKLINLFFIGVLFIGGCDSSSTSSEEVILRITRQQFSLGLVHNSHIGRAYPTPESAYSAYISFELFLSDDTNYEDIEGFAIVDDEGIGWSFTQEEVREAFNEDNNSLVFLDLELRIFDVLSGKLVKAQFLDENNELIREKGFTLDNDFPMPATTTNLVEESNLLQVYIDFYNSPYDGGNLPFPVTIYNTFYSSNTFIVSWLNDDSEIIRQDFHNPDDILIEYSTDDWRYDIPIDNIPSSATKYYTSFLRGWYTIGGRLVTSIDEISN